MCHYIKVSVDDPAGTSMGGRGTLLNRSIIRQAHSPVPGGQVKLLSLSDLRTHSAVTQDFFTSMDALTIIDDRRACCYPTDAACPDQGFRHYFEIGNALPYTLLQIFGSTLHYSLLYISSNDITLLITKKKPSPII